MVAAIKQTEGRSLFASFRETAWHGLGTVFTEEVTDYRRMLELAGLNGWNVRFDVLTGESGVVYTKQRGVVYDDPATGRVMELGTVGNRYEIVQNEDKFSWLQSLSDGARWETAGALSDGAVFGSIAFERETVLDPSGVADVVKTFALVSGSHDGSSGIVGGLTKQRVVCRNTLNIALGNLNWRMSFRHTASVHERMRMQADFFQKAHVYFDAFDVEAQSLFEKKVTDKQYANLVKKVMTNNGKVEEPKTNEKGRMTKWENRLGLFMEAWNGAPNEGIKGTAWGAFNALTEANQWGRNVQDTKKGQENFFAAGAGFDIPTNQFRQNALTLVKSIR